MGFNSGVKGLKTGEIWTGYYLVFGNISYLNWKRNGMFGDISTLWSGSETQLSCCGRR